MLTQAQYIDLMTHCLGKTPDSRHSLPETFNRAGRALVTARPWSWRIRGPVTLSTVANQAYIELPADFCEVRTVYIPSAGAVQRVELATLETLAQIRALSSSYVGTGIIYAFFPSWSSLQQGMTRRVELAPIPTTNATPSFQLIYNAGWKEIDSGDGTATPQVPLEFEHALVLMARAFANNIENQDSAIEDVAVQNEIARLDKEDSRIQPTYGRMSGGAASRMTTTIASRRVVGMAQL